MTTNKIRLPSILRTLLRIITTLLLASQTAIIAFYLVGFGFWAMVACITNPTNCSPGELMTFGIWGSFVAANTYLLTRILRRGTPRWHKKLDVLAATFSTCFTGWSYISLAAKKHDMLGDMIFHGGFAVFNLLLLILVSFPRSNRYLFDPANTEHHDTTA